MPKIAVIFDCYTVEPAGLGVPPYLSTYARYAYVSLKASGLYDRIAYVTIDDFRAARDLGDKQARACGYTDRLTYSLTNNAEDALELLARAEVIVVIIGDAVPSIHLHAQNGSLQEIRLALDQHQGKRVLLGQAANWLRNPSHPEHDLFNGFHSQSFTSDSLFGQTFNPISYDQLDGLIHTEFDDFINQIPWQVIAEIEMYRGCTRKEFCSFCNEPVKNPAVAFRPPDQILNEISALYRAGVRHFRLGQQACFFSYYNRDAGKIELLLSEIRTRCPEIEVLHIDNADPLAVASPNGRRIAKLITEYCSEGNCAAMGVETFDLGVIRLNRLVSTPDVALKAISHVEEYGSEFGPGGQRKLLAGINIIYGLPGETRWTHFENVKWLNRILDEGHYCHRTNIRQAKLFPGTYLEQLQVEASTTAHEDFQCRKRDIEEIYDAPMKERVFPPSSVLKDVHAFFINEQGTWFRRLGSYPIQVVDRRQRFGLYEKADIRVTEYAGRHIYGEALP